MTEPEDPDAILPPSGAGLDLGGLLRQAQDALAARAEAEDAVVEGSSGGGVVTVEVTGGFEFRRVTIDPSVVDPDDVDILEDLVLAAVRDAVNQAVALSEGAFGDLDLGGLDLGGLGELFD
jgi:nucleoid-associated protein EbfC